MVESHRIIPTRERGIMLVVSMPITKTEEQFAIDFLTSDAAREFLSGYEFIRELETPFGIPDAVFFRNDVRADIAYLKSIMGDIKYSPSHARVVSKLKKRSSIVIETIISQTGLSKTYVIKALNDLVSTGIVIKKKNGYTLASELNVPNAGWISIEFKLSDWRKALTQASRHKAFANKCWVVMPSEKHKLLQSRAEIFRKHGISVATYDPKARKIKRVTTTPSASVKSNYSSIDLIGRIAQRSNLINQVSLA